MAETPDSDATPSDGADSPSTEDGATEEGTTQRAQFPKRLGPQARKAAMLGAEDETVRVLVELSPSADPEALSASVRERGGVPGSWSAESRLLTAEIGVDSLEWLAAQPGVVYVDVATPMRD